MRYIRITLLLFAITIFNAACTTVTTSTGHGGEGLPLYMPTPVLIVNEAIETKRVEKLHALVRIGGITTSLYEFSPDISTGIAELTTRIGHGGSLKLRPLPLDLTILTEEVENTDDSIEDQTAEHVKKITTLKSDTTSKYAAIAGVSDSTSISYKSADPAKSFDVMYVPNPDKPFMLNLKPGIFGGKVSATLTNGWQLAEVNGDQDASAAIGSLTTLAGTLLTTKKDLGVSKLTEGTKLELEKLKQSSTSAVSGPAQRASSAAVSGVVEVDFTIIGYVKEVTITTVAPGVYDFSNPTALALTTNTMKLWERISF